MKGQLYDRMSRPASRLTGQNVRGLTSLYALPFYDFDLRASHARTLLPAALASVPFGFVLVRVRVRANCKEQRRKAGVNTSTAHASTDYKEPTGKLTKAIQAPITRIQEHKADFRHAAMLHSTNELELELIQTQMAQKPMLRAEVYAHAMRASQNRKKGSA